MSNSSLGTRAAFAITNALQMLRLHKLRTGLATTGIVVGTMALAAVLMISDGLHELGIADLERSGEAELQLRSLPRRIVDYVAVPRPDVVQFRAVDAIELSELFAQRASVAMRDSGAAVFNQAGRERGVAVMGVLAPGLPTNVGSLHAGRVPSFAGTVSSDSNAVLVSYSLAKLLTSASAKPADVVGRDLTIGGRLLHVVGVVDSVSKQSRLTIWGTAGLARALDPEAVVVLLVRPTGIPSTDKFEMVLSALERWVAENRSGWRSAIQMDAPGYSRLEGIRRESERLRLALSAFCLLTVLVAGIGIANVIFASVVERTREVGIRKAVGARFADVFGQFLVESVTLSGLGGLVGVGAGAGIAGLIAWYIRSSTSQPLFVDLRWQTTLIALSLAIFAGLLAGVMPSLRAARMAPVDSMRTE